MHGRHELSPGLVLTVAELLEQAGNSGGAFIGDPMLALCAAHALRLYHHTLAGKTGNVEGLNSFRDKIIEYAVHEVCRFGFNPTRSRESRKQGHRPESGCSIVRDVLVDCGIMLGEGTVEDHGGTTPKQRGRSEARHLKDLARN